MRRRWLLGLVPCTLAVVVAQATTLGGVTANTLATADAASTASAPLVVTCDNFTGTTGASLSGRAATVAASCASAVWTVHSGTWSIQDNQAAASSLTIAAATVDVGTANCTVQAVVTGLASSGNAAGVVTSHNGASTYLAAVLIKGAPDTIELRLYQTGVPSVLASATATILASNKLSMTRSGSSVSASLNGGAPVTATLTGIQSTALGASKRSGLFGAPSGVRYDDFVVTNP